MTMIPGLDVGPMLDTDNSEIERDLCWISGSLRIPKSDVFGRCRKVNEFTSIKTMKATSSWFYRKCLDKTKNINVCVKKQKIDPDIEDCEDIVLKSTLHEIQILLRLKHDNVIAFVEPVVTSKYGSNYLVVEDVEYFLSDLIDQKIEAIFEKPMIKSIFFQISQGLDYLHSMLIMHRDIHPKNLMFNKDGVLKITNFERATEFYPSDKFNSDRKEDAKSIADLVSKATCKNYLAPEILLTAPKHGPEVDIWAAGCILAKLFLLEEMFPGNHICGILKSMYDRLGSLNDTQLPGYLNLPILKVIPKGEVQKYNCLDIVFKKNGPHSEASITLLKDIFIYNPEHRLTAEYLVAHPYFFESPPGLSVSEVGKIMESSHLMEKMGAMTLQKNA